DEGRFNFHYVHEPGRVRQPAIQKEGELQLTDWSTALNRARETLNGKKMAVLIASDQTQEEASLMVEFAREHFPEAEIFHFGTPGIKSTKDDGPLDSILKMKSKTANLFGVEKLGLKSFPGPGKSLEAVLVLRGGRAVLPELPEGLQRVGIGVFLKEEIDSFQAILPGFPFAEKSGTVFHFE